MATREAALVNAHTGLDQTSSHTRHSLKIVSRASLHTKSVHTPNNQGHNLEAFYSDIGLYRCSSTSAKTPESLSRWKNVTLIWKCLLATSRVIWIVKVLILVPIQPVHSDNRIHQYRHLKSYPSYQQACSHSITVVKTVCCHCTVNCRSSKVAFSVHMVLISV